MMTWPAGFGPVVYTVQDPVLTKRGKRAQVPPGPQVAKPLFRVALLLFFTSQSAPVSPAKALSSCGSAVVVAALVAAVPLAVAGVLETA